MFTSYSIVVLLGIMLAFGNSFNFVRRSFNVRKSKLLPHMSDKVNDINPDCQVYVGHLPLDVDEHMVQNIIAEKVSVFDSFKIMKDKETGESRGFGYLQFADKSQAENALNLLTDLQVNGIVVKVGLNEIKNKSSSKFVKIAPEQSVYVGNLNFGTTEQDLIAMCEKHLGPNSAVKARIAIDKSTGRPRGFAHVDFVSAELAHRAINELNGAMLANRELRVNSAVRTDEIAPTHNKQQYNRDRSSNDFVGTSSNSQRTQHSLFIGNIAWDVTQDVLQSMLDDVLGPEEYSKVRVAIDRESGRPRGFAHVDFPEEASMRRALKALEGIELMGRLVRVDLAQRLTTTPVR